jgi:hypothetical protein
VVGWQGGFSSPVLDGDRVYQVDNGANLAAFDANTGNRLWLFNLGTIQKASPVLADGKLYVGSENGRFWILRPGPDKPVVLDEDQLGTEQTPEAIIASAAVADGRVYLATMDNLYCIGPKGARRAAAGGGKTPARGTATAMANPAPSAGPPTHLQVVPAEVLVKPGDSVTFHARLFDAQGRFVREAVEDAAWGLEGMRGAVNAGHFTADLQAVPRTAQVTVKASGLGGAARVRVIPPLPWSFDFEGGTGEAPPPYWINSTGKFYVREHGGSRALMKRNDIPLTKRGRLFFGPNDAHDYTVAADVIATEKRRQMGDGGVIAQRYALVLFGNAQKLELQPWQAAAARSVSVPFAWKPDTWYHLKLRVDNKPGGLTLVRGKAWPKGEPEPAEWTIEKSDPLGHREGSPGLYADPNSEVYYDNLTVTVNQQAASAP